jgi:hypothetical protein
MPRPVTYIPFLTNQQILDLADGSYNNEYHKIYTQVHRFHTKSFSDAIKVAQKKYRDKKKLDPIYLEKCRKAQKEYYQRHKDDPEKKEKSRLYHQKRYQQKKLEKLNKLTKLP